MMERRKTEAIAAKCQRNKGGISLSSRKEKNYWFDTGDDIDPDQVDDKYLLQLWVAVGGNLWATKKKKLGMANSKSIMEWWRRKKDQDVRRFYTHHNCRILY